MLIEKKNVFKVHLPAKANLGQLHKYNNKEIKYLTTQVPKSLSSFFRNLASITNLFQISIFAVSVDSCGI